MNKHPLLKWFSITLFLLCLSIIGFTLFFNLWAPPVVEQATIFLRGKNPITLEINTPYQDAGAFVLLGDVPIDITTTSGVVDLFHVGTYPITYSYVGSNETLTKERTVQVVDTISPTITLLGDATMTLMEGSAFRDPGVSVSDNDPAINASLVTISGSVDASTPGTYELTYTIQDTGENTASVTRTVIIKAKPIVKPTPVPVPTPTPTPSPTPNGRVVYLTFDDGPSAYTSQILNTLQAYGVNATFFVTGNIVNYPAVLLQSIANGNEIALHSYSHNYAQIYASPTAFWADLNLLRQTLYNLTGLSPNLMRFAGGTNNQVSQQYSPHIMQTLVAEVTNEGLRYTDWNVSSGDASGIAYSPEQLAYNVLSTVDNVNVPIVLMHDSKYNTAQALPIILQGLIDKGYSFSIITENTPLVHFIPL